MTNAPVDDKPARQRRIEHMTPASRAVLVQWLASAALDRALKNLSACDDVADPEAPAFTNESGSWPTP